MEASVSSVVESPTEPSVAPVEAPVAPEVPLGQAPEGSVTTTPLPPSETPCRIELSTGKQHDIRDVSEVEHLSAQAGAGFETLMRVDGKPICVAVEEIVSYE